MSKSSTGGEQLAALRAELARRDLTGFVVPRADEYLGEYVPPSAQRLAWLTGFTGSAGLAVVLRDKAAVFSDGRYTLQVRAEIDLSLFEPLHLLEFPPARWLARVLVPGDRLGFDPRLHTADQVEPLRRACARAGAELVACTDNPLDTVWVVDRPAPPRVPIEIQPLSLAGRGSDDKRAEIAAALRNDGDDALVLTAPDSIAWLLNIRGGDVAHTPVPLSFAIVHADSSVDLFIDPAKLTNPGVVDHLGPTVRTAPPEELDAALDRLGAGARRVRIDAAAASFHVVERLNRAGAQLNRGADPCQMPKACKNAAESAGTRAAHRRDAVAMVRFLSWLDGEAPSGRVDELSAADRLDRFRAEGALYRGPSFATISGTGPNGAIVHYHSTPRTNRRLATGDLYLVDSGGQYLDGTTDITRTIAIGPAGAEERRRFTLVLKGHIAVARARFPVGTTGSQLDVLARQALWSEGLDYDHGTGHGVGSYLSVHEGPQRISKAGNSIALQPGMILSNEPGYYKTGAYGIRIENLLQVVTLPLPPEIERPLLGFETLTLVPIDRALIEPGLLDPAEAAWIEAYHARVRAEIGPLLDGSAAAWLDAATRPLDYC
ncbi:aminopeptidase P family protein [Magnetospirillum molischianum]|nr:aminopeptidase P family protein [Magnetospirillum molischianum]